MTSQPSASIAQITAPAPIAAAPCPAGVLPAELTAFAQLAAALCQAPLASISLNDAGSIHVGAHAALLGRALAEHDPFVEPTLEAADVFEIPNTALDKRFNRASVVTGALSLRAFAGCALRAPGGEALGMVAVYHTAARRLNPAQRGALRTLAQACVAQIGLRARVAELELPGAAPAQDTSRAHQESPPDTPVAMNMHVTTEPPADAALLRALLDSAPVAIYHADRDAALGYVNPAYRRIFGLTPGQTVDDWALGVHPDDRERMQRTWAAFCSDPRPSRFDYRTLTPEGQTRFFAETVVPIEGAPGYVGTIADFTELVAARGDLRKVETLFRNTFDQAPLAIVYADRTGRLTHFNPALCVLLGATAAQLSGKSLAEIVHPDDVAPAALELERLWRGEIEFIETEKRLLRIDGAQIWVRSTTALVRQGSAVECSVEYVRDISQRKQLTDALTKQQTLLEAVISDLPVALLACDVRGHLTHYNRAAVELHVVKPRDSADHGAPASFADAANVYLMDGVTRVPEAEQPLARALRGETISNLELVVAPAQSARRSILASARRLVGPDGETLGAVAVIQDMTESKQRELELERAHKELVTASRQAGMAEVATNVLHNVGNILNSVNISASLIAERLRQSKTASISRLAALLAEQGANLGTFLREDERGRSVPAYLTALGEQLGADQRVALEEISSLRANLEHIKDTVSMQQSYAKRLGVTETVEVVDLVEDSLRLNAGAFARHGVALKRDFAPVPAINVDRHKVLQILVNLLRNAKYACDDAGKPEKLITLRVAPSPLGVRIAVIDNGIGIKPEHMERLFNHGFTTRESGHGFGLHSSALAARELGGTLHAESEGPGHGAAFILDLPISPKDAG